MSSEKGPKYIHAQVLLLFIINLEGTDKIDLKKKVDNKVV